MRSLSLYTWVDYKTLFHLARKRFRSAEDYLHFQKFQGLLLVRHLQNKQVYHDGCKILDIGCGQGGYSLALKESDKVNVVGLDMRLVKRPEITMIRGDALQIPISSDLFDLVICASLIEHVNRQDQLLEELIRVCKPGGTIYLSFPPFYSLNGGHQFKPFHLFGERFALFMATRLKRIRTKTAPTSYIRAFGKYGLYPTTIRKIRKLISRYPVELLEQSTRWLPIDFSHIPGIGEVLTWHVQFLIRKPQR